MSIRFYYDMGAKLFGESDCLILDLCSNQGRARELHRTVS